MRFGIPFTARAASIVSASALALLLTTPAQAASLTVTTGRVDLDQSGSDPATVASLRLSEEVLDVGVAELDLGIEAAQDIESGETGDGEDWEFRSLGLYADARTAGPLYLIGRAGIARQRIEIGGDDSSETQHSLGIGVGVGASLGLLQLELMATDYGDHDDLGDITWISAGIRF